MSQSHKNEKKSHAKRNAVKFWRLYERVPWVEWRTFYCDCREIRSEKRRMPSFNGCLRLMLQYLQWEETTSHLQLLHNNNSKECHHQNLNNQGVYLHHLLYNRPIPVHQDEGNHYPQYLGVYHRTGLQFNLLEIIVQSLGWCIINNSNKGILLHQGGLLQEVLHQE